MPQSETNDLQCSERLPARLQYPESCRSDQTRDVLGPVPPALARCRHAEEVEPGLATEQTIDPRGMDFAKDLRPGIKEREYGIRPMDADPRSEFSVGPGDTGRRAGPAQVR